MGRLDDIRAGPGMGPFGLNDAGRLRAGVHARAVQPNRKELKMPRILVAIDGSPNSEKALEAAVKLAQDNGGQLATVSVLDRSGDPKLEQLAEGVKASSG